MPDTRAETVDLIQQIFFHRTDCYAVQWLSKKDGRAGYSPVCQHGKHWDCGKQDLIRRLGPQCGDNCKNFAPDSLTKEVIAAHLKGKTTIGTYLVAQDGTVNLLAIDCDVDKANDPEVYRPHVQELARQINAICVQLGLHTLVEDSGNKGYHVWLPFAGPIGAGDAQSLGDLVIARAMADQEFAGVHAEVFPKQDDTDRFGNLIKVPLGIHRKTGKRCLFMDPETMEPYPPAEQPMQLSTVIPNPPERVAWVFEEYGRPIRQAARTTNDNVGQQESTHGGIPCFRRMMVGVGEGCRDEVAFRLAVHLYRQGMPEDVAKTTLTKWDSDHNTPELGENVILEKVRSAYSGKYGYGCTNDLIRQFCDPNCPVYKKRFEPEPVDEERLKQSEQLCFLRMDPAAGAIVFCHRGVEFRCRDWRTADGGMKVRVDTWNGQLLFSDTLNLGLAQRRKAYAREVANKDQTLTLEELSSDLAQLEDLLQLEIRKLLAVQEEERNRPAYVMTAEAEAKAIALLKSPRLLWHVNQAIERMGVAGEEENRLIIYLAYTSRLLATPISLAVKGESSSGKSWMSGRVLKLFPGECYKELTDATRQSFFYLEDNDLKHKIVVIAEKPGADKTDYVIRTAQSEGKLTIQVTIKDPETNEMKTIEKEVYGPVMFLMTTTESVLNAENETRQLSLYTDDSRKQTELVREVMYRIYLGQSIGLPAEELELWQNAQRVLKPYKVLIPFIREIGQSFPMEPHRVRRDFGRFCALIEVITFLHQYQREHVTLDGMEYLKATICDYGLAVQLAMKVFEDTVFEVGPKSRELLTYMQANKYDEDPQTGKQDKHEFTRSELANALNWKQETVRKWLRPLVNQGYLVTIGDGSQGGRGKANRYIVSGRSIDTMLRLVSTADLVRKYPDCMAAEYSPFLQARDGNDEPPPV